MLFFFFFFKEISDFFCAVFFFASAFAVYTVPLYNALIIEVFSKTDQCSHFGKAIDTLIIGDNL